MSCEDIPYHSERSRSFLTATGTQAPDWRSPRMVACELSFTHFWSTDLGSRSPITDVSHNDSIHNRLMDLDTNV